MSDPMSGMGGALVGAGAGLLGGWLDRRFQEKMQREAWSREDTAVQRRVADLEAAGLNPVLAAGSAAQSSAPMHMTSLGESASRGAQIGMAAAQMREQFATTRAQRDLIKAQADETRSRAAYLSSTLNDRVLIQKLEAKFQDQMFETRRSIYSSKSTKDYSEAMISNLEYRWKEAYGEKGYEARQLLDMTIQKIMDEYRIPYEQARAEAMKHNAEFMKKNNDWYWFNHTVSPLMQGVRTAAPFMMP